MQVCCRILASGGHRATSFLARPSGTLQMISETACSCSSRRTRRRCGFHMKGLRPLHASPGTAACYSDALSLPGDGRAFSFCSQKGHAATTLPRYHGRCTAVPGRGGNAYQPLAPEGQFRYNGTVVHPNAKICQIAGLCEIFSVFARLTH